MSGFLGAQILGASLAPLGMDNVPTYRIGKLTPENRNKLGIFLTAPALRNLPRNILTENHRDDVLIVGGLQLLGANRVSDGLPADFGTCLWECWYRRLVLILWDRQVTQ